MAARVIDDAQLTEIATSLLPVGSAVAREYRLDT